MSYPVASIIGGTAGSLVLLLLFCAAIWCKRKGWTCGKRKVLCWYFVTISNNNCEANLAHLHNKKQLSTRMYSNRMCTTCSSPYRGFLSRGSLSGDLCLGGVSGYIFLLGVSLTETPWQTTLDRDNPGQRPLDRERPSIERTWYKAANMKWHHTETTSPCGQNDRHV